MATDADTVDVLQRAIRQIEVEMEGLRQRLAEMDKVRAQIRTLERQGKALRSAIAALDPSNDEAVQTGPEAEYDEDIAATIIQHWAAEHGVRPAVLRQSNKGARGGTPAARRLAALTMRELGWSAAQIAAALRYATEDSVRDAMMRARKNPITESLARDFAASLAPGQGR